MNSRSTTTTALDRRISMDVNPLDQISEDCTICCEKITDKAFVNDCLHYFCYKCIKQWICVRAVCPLCVQPISSIINNVRSVDDYDLQKVEPPENDVLSDWDNEVELWAAIADDDNDFGDDISDVHMSSEENHVPYSFEDSDDDQLSSFLDAMDDDESDINFSFEDDADLEILDSDADVSSENGESVESESEEDKSSQCDTSDMEDESVGFENHSASENDECENFTDVSEENDDEVDYTYFNSSNDSDDDDDSLPYYNSEYYSESADVEESDHFDPYTDDY